MIKVLAQELESLKQYKKDYIIDPEKYDDINEYLDTIDEIMLDTLDSTGEQTKSTVAITKIYDAIYNRNILGGDYEQPTVKISDVKSIQEINK